MASLPTKIWDLPDEILCHIFSKLKKEYVIQCVANVCQRWRIIVAQNKIFCNDIQIVVDCDNFINCSHLNEVQDEMSVEFQKVEESKIHIGEKDLEKIPKMQSIKFIEGSRILNQSVDLLIRILDIISKNCQHIGKIEFFSCVGASSDQAIRFLREKYGSIQELIFGVNNSVMYSYPCDEVSSFTNLKSLVLHDRMFKSSDLFHLSEGCRHLNSLWILLCKSLNTDDIMYFIEKKKHNLKELGIGVSLQDSILDGLKECHRLEVLFASDAKNVTDGALMSFAHRSSLKYCSFHQANFKQTTVFNVAGFSREPGIFQHLLILDLTNYENYLAKLFSSWDGWSESSNAAKLKSKGYVEITFNNPVERSIYQPHYSSIPFQEHWMYRHRNK